MASVNFLRLLQLRIELLISASLFL